MVQTNQESMFSQQRRLKFHLVLPLKELSEVDFDCNPHWTCTWYQFYTHTHDLTHACSAFCRSFSFFRGHLKLLSFRHSIRSKHVTTEAKHTSANLPPISEWKGGFEEVSHGKKKSWLLLRKHRATPKPQMSPGLWIKTTYARTAPELVMKPSVIQGIGRCGTRGFAGVEVVATVGQWADSGAWDYFVEHWFAQKESWKQSSDSQRHVTAGQRRGNLPMVSGRSDYSSANGKKAKKIRRLICSGPRYALLYITAITERGRGGLPNQRLIQLRWDTREARGVLL